MLGRSHHAGHRRRYAQRREGRVAPRAVRRTEVPTARCERILAWAAGLTGARLSLAARSVGGIDADDDAGGQARGLLRATLVLGGRRLRGAVK